MIFKKIYKPAWNEIYATSDAEGKISIHTNHHPEEFYLVIHEQGQEDQIVITNKEEFNRLELGRTWYNSGAILEKQ